MINRAFPILAVSIFAVMLGSGIVVPLLPLYAESLGATGIGLGVIFAGFAISRTLVTPLFGRLSDRHGRRSFIVVGLLLYAVISPAFLWADSVVQLTLVRFAHGIAGGLILPIAQAYVGDISPEGEEGKWMGYANAAFFGGFGFGPLLGGVVTRYYGMDVAFFAMGGLSLLAFFIALFFLPEVARKHVSSAPRLSFREMGRSRLTGGLFSYRLAQTLARAAFFTFLPVFAVTRLGLSIDLIGILFAVHVLLVAVLGIPLGRVADRLSRRFMVVLGCLVTFAFMVLLPSASSFPALMALIILGSIGNAVSTPAASALVIEEGRRYGMGSTVAVFTTALNIGMAVGPILAGAIVDYAGIDTAFYFGAVVVLVGAGVFVWFTSVSRSAAV